MHLGLNTNKYPFKLETFFILSHLSCIVLQREKIYTETAESQHQFVLERIVCPLNEYLVLPAGRVMYSRLG